MKILFLNILCLCPFLLNAQMNAQEGLDKLKTNLDSSKVNLEQYQNNLKVVETNLIEMRKGNDSVRSQEESFRNASKAHSSDLVRIAASASEFDRLIKEENKKKTIEEAQLAELEKLRVKLQAQIDQRSQNLDAYHKDLTTLAEQRNLWDSKTQEFQEAAKKLNIEKAEVAARTKEQQDKKQNYEGEIARWKKESERQQKAIDSFKFD